MASVKKSVLPVGMQTSAAFRLDSADPRALLESPPILDMLKMLSSSLSKALLKKASRMTTNFVSTGGTHTVSKL